MEYVARLSATGSPTDLTMSLAAGARMHGVQIVEGVGVSSIRTAALAGMGCSKVQAGASS